MSQRPHRNFYGRKKGRVLKSQQISHLDDVLSKFALNNVDWVDNPDRKELDLIKVFGCSEIWLEIGFGKGEYLVHQALQNPKLGFIGVEPYLNGVAALAAKIQQSHIKNIRIHPGDVRDVMDVLPSHSISRVFLLYPDPWPKKRHHRRRFVTDEYLYPLVRIMKSKATLHIATDIQDYARQALEEVPKAGLEWLAEIPNDWRTPWADWCSTRYEQKAISQEHTLIYLSFIRHSNESR